MKLFAGLALSGAIVIVTAAPAAAASPAPTRPPAADVAAARQVAEAASPTVARFFAARGGTAKITASAAAQMAPRLTGPTVPVYELDPGFVTGRSDTVARLSFLATEAVSADGQRASVWAVRRDGAWRLANIASGADEQNYARNTGTVFREPQINGWYRLDGGRVYPLNAEARQVTGAPSVPLAAYQRAVRGRYGDRLPGSAYDRQGMAGGYGPKPSETGDNNEAPVVFAGLGLLLAAGGGGLFLRRRAVRR
ncbi:LPXTG cell wall anchor domain-containing protein [Actinomadura syzygii]|uniref:LPXTG cell wall anchor domain-containing protein n=1 Tax=Actinomadura syzygii TaxID=1427538 RepID=A0A5D0UMH6_9ACTN|nr:LPXTG cell wall anchor domain-containing protein [Actinomadura syzygii]TYC18329.1 LPXTG cell wall anchor domain-containing protein [Actinomadura syzygii]